MNDQIQRAVKKVKRAARIIANAKNLVAFTGAGMSAESGIPTFRDAGGLWEKMNPLEVGKNNILPESMRNNPDELRKFISDSINSFKNAKPNPGHESLAKLERLGILKTVITQNVDELYKTAGNTEIHELHGNLYRRRCKFCGKKESIDKVDLFGQLEAALENTPLSLGAFMPILNSPCSCGGKMRLDVVIFGEPVQELRVSFEKARKCDVMLIIGTTGAVFPAADIPVEAKSAGAKIIEINPNTNAYISMDADEDVYLDMPSGEALPIIMDVMDGKY